MVKKNIKVDKSWKKENRFPIGMEEKTILEKMPASQFFHRVHIY